MTTFVRRGPHAGLGLRGGVVFSAWAWADEFTAVVYGSPADTPSDATSSGPVPQAPLSSEPARTAKDTTEVRHRVLQLLVAAAVVLTHRRPATAPAV